jgi:ankyrin repeat protein
MRFLYCALAFAALAGCSSPDKQLYQALVDDDPTSVKEAVERGAKLYEPASEPPHKFYDFLPPLSHAAYSGQVDSLKMLVNAGADPNRADSYGWYPLHYACFKRQPHVIEYLLKVGVDRNVGLPDVRQISCSIIVAERFTANTTPLMLAVLAESSKSVELLLKHKAKVDLRDADGHTAIWQVSEEIHRQNSRRKVELEKIRRLLLQAGANPNIRDNTGRTLQQILRKR